MSELLEVIMIVSFGASWPLNVMKSYRARTTKGKSIAFLYLILFGYAAGIVSKIVNYIIFLDGNYSNFADKIGEQGTSYKNTFKSFHNYIVNSSVGGTVNINKGSSSVIVSVKQGKSAVSGGKRYFEGQEIPLNNNAVTVVNYEGITSAELSETATDIHAQVGVESSVAAELFVAIYDSEGKLVSCGLTSVDSKTSF